MGQNYLIPIWDSFWCQGRRIILSAKEGRLWSFLTNWFDGWRAGIYIVLVSRTVGPAQRRGGRRMVSAHTKDSRLVISLHLRLYNAVYTLIGCCCVYRNGILEAQKRNTSLRLGNRRTCMRLGRRRRWARAFVSGGSLYEIVHIVGNQGSNLLFIYKSNLNLSRF